MRKLISPRAILVLQAPVAQARRLLRSCLIADIESLAYYGGINEKARGYLCAFSKRFPFCIFYSLTGNIVLVTAIIDACRDPLWVRKRLE